MPVLWGNKERPALWTTVVRWRTRRRAENGDTDFSLGKLQHMVFQFARRGMIGRAQLDDFLLTNSKTIEHALCVQINGDAIGNEHGGGVGAQGNSVAARLWHAGRAGSLCGRGWGTRSKLLFLLRWRGRLMRTVFGMVGSAHGSMTPWVG